MDRLPIIWQYGSRLCARQADFVISTTTKTQTDCIVTLSDPMVGEGLLEACNRELDLEGSETLMRPPASSVLIVTNLETKLSGNRLALTSEIQIGEVASTGTDQRETEDPLAAKTKAAGYPRGEFVRLSGHRSKPLTSNCWSRLIRSIMTRWLTWRTPRAAKHQYKISAVESACRRSKKESSSRYLIATTTTLRSKDTCSTMNALSNGSTRR